MSHRSRSHNVTRVVRLHKKPYFIRLFEISQTRFCPPRPLLQQLLQQLSSPRPLVQQLLQQFYRGDPDGTAKVKSRRLDLSAEVRRPVDGSGARGL